MTPFSELAASREYWLTKIQNELYDSVEQYLERKGWTRSQFAEQLGVTKGYISQVLNGDFDHKLSKLIDLSLAVGVVPNLRLEEFDTYIENYLSGYDGCLRSDKAHITFEVTNNLPTYDYEDLYSASNPESNFVFSDNEVKVTYIPSRSTAYAS